MDKAAPALTKEYTKKFDGRKPGLYTLEAYNATIFFLEAIKKGNITRETINTFIGTNQVKGVGLTMQFGPGGDPLKTVMNEYTVKKGDIVWVREAK